MFTSWLQPFVTHENSDSAAYETEAVGGSAAEKPVVLRKLQFLFGKPAAQPVVFFHDMLGEDDREADDMNAIRVVLEPVEPEKVWECVNLFMAR